MFRFINLALGGISNGMIYAAVALALVMIWRSTRIVNFAQGGMLMMTTFIGWDLVQVHNVNYWVALVVAPIVVGALGVVIERLFLRHLYKIDPIYGLLLTFGLALIAEGVLRYYFGVSGQSYDKPELLSGATDLGFMVLPNYRAWVVIASLVVCLGTWFLIERTSLGATLRAGTENPALVQAFGINVPLMVTLTYAGGAGLAALAGVLAAPVIQVTPLMGSSLIIIVFAVVVIGGMGSILGSIITGLALGLIEGLTKVFYPEASSIVVFVIMAIVLMVRPAGLFGKEA
ncbi:MAG: branched-chain amino acid ABC transporter permease [Rhizobacter sp.]|nr:branched-chain amino acid ABC transporter permease [Rhizobacter sp.]